MKYMTIVFEITDEQIVCNINPFKLAIPGLKVIGVSACDLMEESEKLRELLEETK